jgi:uncharacterized protein YndB with AHSA1/START domain
MTEPAAAVLEDEEGRVSLRLEQRLAHPAERVWRALTEPDELAVWHQSPYTFEPRAGGAVRYPSATGPPTMADGRVTAYDPPRLLAYTWGEDDLRFELHADGAGTRLVLVHTFADRLKAARDAAGWHVCLRALAGALEGEPPEATTDADGLPAGWQDLNRRYQKRFGIAPERATPPPG